MNLTKTDPPKHTENTPESLNGADLHDKPERFFNRELSWLDFNRRVLATAENPNVPLLERVRFLSISAFNLDEFHMVRVAGLKAQIRAGITGASQDGLTPSQQIERIDEQVAQLTAAQQSLWKELRQSLRQDGLWVIDPQDVKKSDKIFLREAFDTHIFPVLTPLTIDPAHPFPFIPNAGFALALEMHRHEDGERFQALIPVPTHVDRFVELPTSDTTRRFMLLEDLICMFLDALFPGCEMLGRCAFRVIRDSDIAIEDEAEDLVREFELLLRRRRRGRIVRVTLEDSAPESLRQFLIRRLKATPQDVLPVDGILDLRQLEELISDPPPEQIYPPFTPRFPERIIEHDGNCFAAIRKKDILVHHPYESFDVVVQFLRQAAADPNVVAIKQTLYRTLEDSPLTSALVQAAEAGKNVTALIELKARFDEEANLRLARKLERAGVQVVYGFIRYKTHAKISLVVRREQEQLQTYTHFGTGNYHPVNARIYTDLSLFTADPELGRDSMKLFNYVTSYSKPEDLSALAISPLNLKTRLLELIEQEIAHARNKRPATIWAKLNALADPDVIDSLYRASQAGVIIQLVVRGICCLRPGIPGLSDNISVKSIVGRFLEHARIVAFGNGHELPSAKAALFISSADWMPRNLDSRVEALTPVRNPTVHSQILEQIFVANLNDRAHSWHLMPDGRSVRLADKGDTDGFSCHQYFMETSSLSGRGSALTLAHPPDLHPS